MRRSVTYFKTKEEAELFSARCQGRPDISASPAFKTADGRWAVEVTTWGLG